VYSLAEKVAGALTSSHAISLDVKDISSSVPVDLAAVRQAFEADIALRGIRTMDAASVDSQVQVTISQNSDGYLLVASVHQGDAQPVFVVAVANSQVPPRQTASEPDIRRKIVWRQSRQLVDFVQATTGANQTVWYLLEPDRLEVYEFDGGEQVLHVAKAISKLSGSRDLRGRLLLTDATHVQSFLGAVRCDGQWNPDFSLECHENSARQWPAGSASWQMDPSRNYFSGRMTLSSAVETKFPSFYSAASPSPEIGGQSSSRWAIAEVDDQTQLFAGTAEPAATFAGWGSDILSIAPACGSSWQVLVSGTGDWTQPDKLQLYEIRERRAIAVGQPLEFPGPILMLWPSEDGQSARVISRSLQTGLYEASIVSLSCGN
jgi:hypothetical protein